MENMSKTHLSFQAQLLGLFAVSFALQNQFPFISFVLKGESMFDNDQQIVNSLLSDNNNFKRLFDKHVNLNQMVDDANDGDIVVDDIALEKMKKEKLLIKDQMVNIIEGYRQAHA